VKTENPNPCAPVNCGADISDSAIVYVVKR
jgi:hypothetical protein